jgi:hypothetical protein
MQLPVQDQIARRELEQRGRHPNACHLCSSRAALTLAHGLWKNIVNFIDAFVEEEYTARRPARLLRIEDPELKVRWPQSVAQQHAKASRPQFAAGASCFVANWQIDRWLVRAHRWSMSHSFNSVTRLADSEQFTFRNVSCPRARWWPTSPQSPARVIRTPS